MRSPKTTEDPGCGEIDISEDRREHVGGLLTFGALRVAW